jgi:hypothetical protein
MVDEGSIFLSLGWRCRLFRYTNRESISSQVNDFLPSRLSDCGGRRQTSFIGLVSLASVPLCYDTFQEALLINSLGLADAYALLIYG